MSTDQKPGEAVIITTPTDVEIRAERVFATSCSPTARKPG
jgi:hypothetical protein